MVRSGQDHFRTGQVMSGQAWSVQVRAGKIKSGQAMYKSGQARTD